MESNCCRVQQTTRVKNDAHAAQSRQLIESGGLVVGSLKIRTVPKAAHAEMWFGLQLKGFFLPETTGGIMWHRHQAPYIPERSKRHAGPPDVG
jgi:hypothetical protein